MCNIHDFGQAANIDPYCECSDLHQSVLGVFFLNVDSPQN